MAYQVVCDFATLDAQDGNHAVATAKTMLMDLDPTPVLTQLPSSKEVVTISLMPDVGIPVLTRYEAL